MRAPIFALAMPAALLADAAAAQQGKLNGFIVDAQAKATVGAGYITNGLLGVCVDGQHHYYVSGRRESTMNPHQLFEFDAAGNYVAAYAQPAGKRLADGDARGDTRPVQVLGVGVDAEVLHHPQVFFAHAAHSVAASSSHTEDP